MIAAALAISGCSYTVGPFEPKPNVALPSKAPAFELELAPTVKDTYEVPGTNGLAPGTVTSWRSSLEKGFAVGFPSGGAANGTAKLRVELAEFSFVPAAVDGAGRTVGARAQVKFRGRWTVGETEIPVSGTAESKSATTAGGDIHGAAASAVETMYESFGQALLKQGSAVPTPGDTVSTDKTEVDPKP